MMDKYQAIDEMIVMVDAIFDQRGVQRATALCDLIQRLTALKAMLKEDDDVQSHTGRPG